MHTMLVKMHLQELSPFALNADLVYLWQRIKTVCHVENAGIPSLIKNKENFLFFNENFETNGHASESLPCIFIISWICSIVWIVSRPPEPPTRVQIPTGPRFALH